MTSLKMANLKNDQLKKLPTGKMANLKNDQLEKMANFHLKNLKIKIILCPIDSRWYIFAERLYRKFWSLPLEFNSYSRK